MSERLLTYLYQYGLGGLVFLASIWLLLRRGMLGDDAIERRRWVLLMVLGIQVLTTGLIGEMITFKNFRRRDSYSVKEVIG